MLAVERRFQALEQQIDLARAAKDDEVSSSLRRFGTVLICGFVERSVEVVLLERLRDRAHPRVLNFVKSHFKRGTNYNCENICQLLDRFDPDWGREFESFMKNNEKEVDALASTYSVRNSVAHGGSGGISVSALRDRLDDARKVIDAPIIAARS